MKKTDWIMSYGGPLIFMEQRLRKSWGGIVRLTVDTNSGTENDYERACQCKLLLNPIALRDGKALILGDRPLNTSFWQAANGVLYIVRVLWTEPSTDIDALLSAADFSSLPLIEDSIVFFLETSEFMIFDSVEDGKDEYSSIRHSLPKGKYYVSTKMYIPDNLTSLYVHEFKVEIE